jgi:hypothetical protein
VKFEPIYRRMVRLDKLDPSSFSLVDLLTAIFIGRHHFYRVPRPIRFAFLHAGLTWVTALTFPPAVDLPGIVIPILWAGSFSITYSIMAIARL